MEINLDSTVRIRKLTAMDNKDRPGFDGLDSTPDTRALADIPTLNLSSTDTRDV
jgi:hypothetical protein